MRTSAKRCCLLKDIGVAMLAAAIVIVLCLLPAPPPPEVVPETEADVAWTADAAVAECNAALCAGQTDRIDSIVVGGNTDGGPLTCRHLLHAALRDLMAGTQRSGIDPHLVCSCPGPVCGRNQSAWQPFKPTHS